MIQEITIKVLSSIIYDVFKKTVGSEKKISLEDEVKTKLATLLMNYDYSGVVAFMEEPSTFRYICSYVKLTSLVYQKNKIEVETKRESSISYLVNKNSLYIKTKNYNSIPKNELFRFYNHVISILEYHVIDVFPDELLAIPMLLNEAVERLERAIRDHKETGILEELTKYEIIKKKYISILKDQFKTNHVPGVDNLRFSQFYIEPRFSYFIKKEIGDVKSISLSDKNEVKWTNIFQFANFISIIGGPGYGKTLFLKKLVVNYEDLNLDNSSQALPIYCNLKEYVESKNKSKHFSIEDFLLDSMITYSGLDEEDLNKKFLRYFMDSGNCLIFLDALDEVESHEREKLSNLIVSYFNRVNTNNKICITTRDRSLIPDTPIIFKVNKINIAEVEEYLSLMVKINSFDKNDIIPFLNQSAPLMKEGFLANFLTLALMVNIYKAYRKLPENKIELYEKCTTYIAKEREKDKRVKFDFDLMRTIIDNDITFETLANLGRRNNKEVKREEIVAELIKVFIRRYGEENQASNAVNHFLDYCEERTELYVHGSKEQHFKFFHRSFFEFFYSKYITKNLKGNVSLYNELSKFNSDSEVPELLLAYLKSENYPRYLKFVDIILQKVAGSTENYNMLIEVMYSSEEVDHLQSFYDIFFGDSMVNYFTDIPFINTSKLSEVIKKCMDFKDFSEKLWLFYPESAWGWLLYLFIRDEEIEEVFMSFDNIVIALGLDRDIFQKKFGGVLREKANSIGYDEFNRKFRKHCISVRIFDGKKMRNSPINELFSEVEIKEYYEKFKKYLAKL